MTPTAHAFRHLPLSPPDTDHDLSHIPASLSGNLDVDTAPAATHYPNSTPERIRYQPRRTSALSYQNSGARDPHDRNHTRSPRNLVVVIPPVDFPLDQGRLGGVLSMGPRHRLSQGILMPLFPSMVGQLNAIAREYNFPSIVGLCLYLHVIQNGITMTPRISDDSWQYLFGHLFEGRPPSGQQLPIGGSIEFDIDLNKARWFEAWAAGTLQDSDPAFPPVVITQESFGAHWRVGSRTTDADEQAPESRWDASASHTLVANSRPGTLAHPRKLSLVDRLDLRSLHVPSKSQDHPDDPEYPTPSHAIRDLSPIPQSAIPQATKSDLERRVNSWRATTELHPASMAEAYQPVPDVGVSVDVDVTIMDEYALERNFQRKVKDDEPIWALTSRSAVTESPIVSSQPLSVHLDRRVNGTVPLTPTTATSWGPADKGIDSIAPGASRLPSPDMGERIVEGVTVPSRCAIWGDSFGWRSAATWRGVYPYSVSQMTHVKPVQLQVQLQDPNNHMPQYLDLVTYQTVDSSPGTHFPFSTFESSSRSVWGSSFGWHGMVTWRKVYPYSVVAMQLVPIQLRGAGNLESKYPNLCIYPTIYPYIEIYPACTVEEDVSQPVHDGLSNSVTAYPDSATYPYFDIYPPVVEVVKMESGQVDASICSTGGVLASYPNLIIYPAIYPHFNLYPKVLQITETPKRKEADVRLMNAGCLTAQYPNIIIYPNAYPYLEIYPTLDVGPASQAVWGISFGWSTAKTWLRVYPLHAANQLTRRYDDQGKSVSTPRGQSSAINEPDTVVKKQAVWGSSFGWKSAATWRAVWPTSYAQIHPNVSLMSDHLGQQGKSSMSYPCFVIYPTTYPHFDIYPPCVATVAVESQTTKNSQITVNLIPHYPNLAIYPTVYPHLDVYPTSAKALVTVGSGTMQSNLHRRRVEMWRARTAAQVGLAELLANNHMWEGDDHLHLDMDDYAWSQTSAGPTTPPLESTRTPSVPRSIHIDRRIQGSVLLTPSTATTWGPQDVDWHADVTDIEPLPSPDLGERVFDDTGSSGFVQEYPHLVVYPPAYPYFELYPTWTKAKASIVENQVNESIAHSDIDICPPALPYSNKHPPIETPNDATIQPEQVGVRLASLYPNFDIYHPCYPYNLDYIYPIINTIESAQMLIEVSCDYPWFFVYSPVYPFIIPYPGSVAEVGQPCRPDLILPTTPPVEWKVVTVKLLAQYPTLDLYPASYPWSLQSIYPVVFIGNSLDAVKPQYPCMEIYPPVYPFVQPYPGASDSIHFPGTFGVDECGSAKTLSERKHTNSESVMYPCLDLYPTTVMPAPQEAQAVPLGDLATPVLQLPVTIEEDQKVHSELHTSERNLEMPPRHQLEMSQDSTVWTANEHVPGQVMVDTDVGDMATPLRMDTIPRRKRKTHMELHASVFRSLGKQPARDSKTHVQLHTEVFQDGVVSTPSGYVQDIGISSPTEKSSGDVQGRISQRNPPQDNSTIHPLRLGATQSPDKVVFPFGQPSALLPPLRVRSPGLSPQQSPAVSETPLPRISPSSVTNAHKRSASSRFTQAVKSMVPGLPRRNSSATADSPSEGKERAQGHQSPRRFLPLAGRRPIAVPPNSTSEFLTRAPPSSQRKESSVWQRARAYEHTTAVNQSSGTTGSKETYAPFTLPPLRIPPTIDVVETMEKSNSATS